MTNDNILTIIKGVRKILTPQTAWTRHVPARNKHNQPVIPYDPSATCYDIVGAIMVIAERTNLKASQFNALMYLRKYTNGMEIGRWNDAQGTTHDDVLKLLDTAIHDLDQPQST
jgi:hypothetical protein